MESFIRIFARKTHNHVVLQMLDYHGEKKKPGSSAGGLLKSMTQIANFSKKQLRKEDFCNMYKDFDTLLRIDDITDLELSDFNSWEINLEHY